MRCSIERIEFNAPRVMDPRTVLSEAALHGLQPREFTVIKPGGRVQASDFDGKTLAALAAERYSLGMFVFNKSTGDGGNL